MPNGQTGRRWPTSVDMANRIVGRLIGETGHPTLAALSGSLVSALESWFASGSFAVERKICRLTEKLKDAIEAEVFGPLFVDQNGNRVAPVNYDPAQGHQTTQAYEIWKAFKDIYNYDVLNSVDEEGNLLP